MGDQIQMYTYIENHQLYVVMPHSGRIFRVRESPYDQFIEVVLEKVLQYQADVVELIKSTQAQSIEG